nr:MAG TPA_asm: hypothetical protein [Caudoviricetes sp.]
MKVTISKPDRKPSGGGINDSANPAKATSVRPPKK